MGAYYVLNDLREETNDTVTVAYVHLITKSVQTIASPEHNHQGSQFPWHITKKKKNKKKKGREGKSTTKFQIEKEDLKKMYSKS
jgi:hypothetical protein